MQAVLDDRILIYDKGKGMVIMALGKFAVLG
jgi:hypothetical protein